jgi:zona occludens toxin
MINIILGPPGGGKSYEAVVYHILPALRDGRKVITNLPLNIDLLRRVDVKYPALIDLRMDLIDIVEKKSVWNQFHRLYDSLTVNRKVQPFSTLRDFGDSWRHPTTGTGPLYVIDECHKALPARGTSLEVDEWFAEHRHELADVLLLTQSYGKVSKSVIDLLQVCYRVKKATALGLETSYIRKVQDGVRGEVVNETVRSYDSRFFQFYKSHTKSTAPGQEQAANDIIPLWKRWPFIGMMIIFPLFFFMLYTAMNHKKPVPPSFVTTQPASALPIASVRIEPVQSAPLALPASTALPVSSVSAVPTTVDFSSSVLISNESKPVTPSKFVQTASHPFDGYVIHITSFVESSERWMYGFSVDQNGQDSFHLAQLELEKSGYSIKKLSNCAAMLTYKDIHFFVVCDTARAGSSRGLMQDDQSTRGRPGT